MMADPLSPHQRALVERVARECPIDLDNGPITVRLPELRPRTRLCAADREVRDAAIIEARRTQTAKQVARAFKLSTQRIDQICKNKGEQ